MGASTAQVRYQDNRHSGDLIMIAGPTAVGKSEVALSLARIINGEIISVDSMQVYRGLDIGTAKPSAEERRRVSHHLLDILDLTESFDAAQFVTRAHQAVQEIRARGRVPILCGGTGLYFRAFLGGLGETPASDPVMRQELESIPLPLLLQELAARDLETYRRTDRQNPRRIIRALEVIRLTGRPFSAQRALWQTADSRSSADLKSQTLFSAWWFYRPVEELRRRIDDRVTEMFQRGLVAETEGLLLKGLSENRTAMQALGYRQVVEHLQGHRNLQETVQLVKTRTRQFAKKQVTWFRRQPEFEFFPIPASSNCEVLAQSIADNHKARLVSAISVQAVEGYGTLGRV